MLSFDSGSAIKRITAGVKARPVTVLCQVFDPAGRAFTLRLNQIRTKKEYSFALPEATLSEHWPL